MKGIVTKITDKGYGFIQADDGSSLFFHGNDCEGGFEGFEQLQEGEEVNFDVSDGRNGKAKAVNISRA